MLLGQPTYPKPKGRRDKSMSAKRGDVGGAQAAAPQGPRDMAKATLPESQLPVVQKATRCYGTYQQRHRITGPDPTGTPSLPSDGRWGLTPFKGTNGTPTSR